MEPLEKLKMLCAWESEPILDESEVESVLNGAAIRDSDGNSPTNDNWEPTYDIDRAVADAWLIKAGKAASLTEVDPPDPGIFTSRIFENCMRMSRRYSSRIAHSSKINGGR